MCGWGGDGGAALNALHTHTRVLFVYNPAGPFRRRQFSWCPVTQPQVSWALTPACHRGPRTNQLGRRQPPFTLGEGGVASEGGVLQVCSFSPVAPPLQKFGRSEPSSSEGKLWGGIMGFLPRLISEENAQGIIKIAGKCSKLLR